MKDTAGAGGMSQLLAEMREQPEVVARALERQQGTIKQVADTIRRHSPRAVVLVARGSSDNVAVYGRYLLEIRNRMLTSLAAPSTCTLYGAGPRLSDTVVIAISQSGMGEDVVTYVQSARDQGAITVAVVNDGTSPLASTADWVLECLAGPEVSIPATKTVTAQMALLASLSVALDDDGGLAQLGTLPRALARALDRREAAAALAQALSTADATSVIGRGFAYPVALEIALKLKETTYTYAEPFSAADFFHGPLALVQPGYAALMVDVGGRSTQPVLDAADAVRKGGGRPFLLSVGTAARGSFDSPTLELPDKMAEFCAPVAAVALGQLLAAELAAVRGVDPAHPRGLRKVTSTR